MHIFIKNSSNKPIYDQVAQQIKEQILDGSLTEGYQLPSIRNLAKELGISVITTKKAYDLLDQMGLIHTVQGKGSYVAEKNQDLLRQVNETHCQDHLRKAMDYGRRLGLSLEDLYEKMKLMEDQDE